MSAYKKIKESITKSWQPFLINEFNKTYMSDLQNYLAAESALKKTIYPDAQNIFSAFKKTSFEKTKVVIIGQDPYHGEDQAHGMCFSVKKNVKIPPSLRNIYKELESDLGIEAPSHGCLEDWAEQGVLLLNSVLTVEHSKAASHQKKGWETFTDKVIEVLNNEKSHLVFLLWGAPAQKKGAKIDEKKHLILKAPHPSPLSSYRGFFGSKPFSKSNNYLKKHKLGPVDWSID